MESAGDVIGRLQRRIRLFLWVFIVGLVLSGVTAFPLVQEVNLLTRWLDTSGLSGTFPALAQWIATVQHALNDADARYPFLFYGTDWLAFGHLVIALFFLGPLRDPVRNVFVLKAGVAACVLVFPLAFICGPLRGIPYYWQWIDCSFGVLGAIPLLFCIQYTNQLERLERDSAIVQTTN